MADVLEPTRLVTSVNGRRAQNQECRGRAHVSAGAAAALPSLEVGKLCEHLEATGRVDVHLLPRLHIVHILLLN